MNDFKPVGFGWGDLYEVNSSGVIRRIGSARAIGTVSGKGYVRVQFSRGSETKTYLAHKIVADVFLGVRPDGYQIDHINGCKHDNRAENLRYCTAKENIRYTCERGSQAFGERNGAAALTNEQVIRIRSQKAAGGRYWGAKQLAKEFGVHLSTIRRAGMGNTHVFAFPRALAKEQQ